MLHVDRYTLFTEQNLEDLVRCFGGQFDLLWNRYAHLV